LKLSAFSFQLSAAPAAFAASAETAAPTTGLNADITVQWRAFSGQHAELNADG
jgi:hypothetical protein